MRKKLFLSLLFLAIFGFTILTAPIAKVSAQKTEPILAVTNLSEVTVNYTFDQILSMTQTTPVPTYSCYGEPLVTSDWNGVSLSDFLVQAGLNSSVNYINFIAVDGFTITLSIAQAMASDTFIGYKMDSSSQSPTLHLLVASDDRSIWPHSITNMIMGSSSSGYTQDNTSSAGGSFDDAVIQKNMGHSYIELPPAGGSQPTDSSSGQSITQQQVSPPPSNATSTQPISPPTSALQNDPKISDSNSLGFPVLVVYGIALGVTIAVITLSYVAYGKKQTKH